MTPLDAAPAGGPRESSAAQPSVPRTRVALAQLASPDDESVEQRRARVEAELMRLAGEGVALIVLPELWPTGYGDLDAALAEAEEISTDADPARQTSPTVALGQRVARATGALVHLGSLLERAAGQGLVRNTTVIVHPDGRILHRASKVHLFTYRSREAEVLAPADSIGTVATPLGETALATCYDLRFDGLWGAFGALGASAAIVPAAWPLSRLANWGTLTRARATLQQLTLIAVNAAGEQRGVRQAGHSVVVDARGRVLAELGEGEEVRVIDLTDAVTPAEARQRFPVLRERLQPVQYAALVSPETGPSGDERAAAARRAAGDERAASVASTLALLGVSTGASEDAQRWLADVAAGDFDAAGLDPAVVAEAAGVLREWWQRHLAARAPREFALPPRERPAAEFEPRLWCAATVRLLGELVPGDARAELDGPTAQRVLRRLAPSVLTHDDAALFASLRELAALHG